MIPSGDVTRLVWRRFNDAACPWSLHQTCLALPLLNKRSYHPWWSRGVRGVVSKHIIPCLVVVQSLTSACPALTTMAPHRYASYQSKRLDPLTNNLTFSWRMWDIPYVGYSTYRTDILQSWFSCPGKDSAIHPLSHHSVVSDLVERFPHPWYSHCCFSLLWEAWPFWK